MRLLLVLEVFCEGIAEGGSGAEEEAFYGGDGGFEGVCDFFVGEVFVSAEDEGEALVIGEGLDGGVDGFLEFRFEEGGVGLGGGVVGDLEVMFFFELV